MKFCVLIISLSFILSFGANAQIEAGRMMLGGSASVSVGSKIGHDNTNFNVPYTYKTLKGELIPRGGILLSNNFLIGLGIGYNFTLVNYDGTNYYINVNSNQIPVGGETNSRSHGILVSPYFRYYLGLSDKISFFIHGELGAGYEYQEDYLENPDRIMGTANYTTAGVGISIGVSFLLTRNLLLEAGVGLLNFDYRYSKDDNFESTNLNFQLTPNNLGIGLYFLL